MAGRQWRAVECMMRAGIQENVVVFHFVRLMSCSFDCQEPRDLSLTCGGSMRWKIMDGKGERGQAYGRQISKTGRDSQT